MAHTCRFDRLPRLALLPLGSSAVSVPRRAFPVSAVQASIVGRLSAVELRSGPLVKRPSLHNARCRVCAAASEVASAPQTSGFDAGADQSERQDIPERWRHIIDAQAKGELVNARIVAVNRGGAVCFALGVKGFIPYSRLDAERVYGRDFDSGATMQSMDQVASDEEGGSPAYGQQRQIDLNAMEALVGVSVRAKILQVDVPRGSLVLCERSALTSDLMASRGFEPGAVVDGVVRCLKDFGAFVALRSADGHMHGAEGLIHISELSWDHASTPESVVQPGDHVRCKVLRVDEARTRISLSLKRMDQDPLKQKLEDVLPLDNVDKLMQVPAEIPASIEAVCTSLNEQEGVDGVTLGRQVEERRAVSQDLELWISREAVEDGYNLVARSGRVVQELHVATSLPAVEMRTVVQRVLQQLL